MSQDKLYKLIYANFSLVNWLLVNNAIDVYVTVKPVKNTFFI